MTKSSGIVSWMDSIIKVFKNGDIIHTGLYKLVKHD